MTTGLVLFIVFKSLLLGQTRDCLLPWMKEGLFPHLLSSPLIAWPPPPPPPPSSFQCVTSEKSREYLPPLLEDFPILWHPDKLWLTSSMWVRETWRHTACIAFCNYICFTALFLLSSLSPPSKRKVDLWVCVHVCVCTGERSCTHSQEWTSIIPVHHLWAPAIFLTSGQTTLNGRKAFVVPSTYIFVYSFHSL